MTHEARRTYWRQVVKACNERNPEISKKEWFKQNSIQSKTYYYWQKQFRNELLVEMQGSQPVPVESSPLFVEIDSGVYNLDENAKKQVPPEQPAIFPELMIRANGCEIYVSNAISYRTLETVMKVITNRA